MILYQSKQHNFKTTERGFSSDLRLEQNFYWTCNKMWTKIWSSAFHLQLLDENRKCLSTIPVFDKALKGSVLNTDCCGFKIKV